MFSIEIQLFLYFLCFLRYETFTRKRVERAVRVLPHNLKRLLRKYNGELGVSGMGEVGKATKFGVDNDGSRISFNWGCLEVPVVCADGCWDWFAIDRDTAWGCRCKGLILGPVAAGRCWVPVSASDVWPWLHDTLAGTMREEGDFPTEPGEQTYAQSGICWSYIHTNLPLRFGKVLFKLFRYSTMDIFIASCVSRNPRKINYMSNSMKYLNV